MRFLSSILALLLCVLLCQCERKSTVELSTAEKVLIIGNSNEPKALDPHLVSGVVESNILRSVFEGLTNDHPSLDGKAIPGAAARWESNADATEWTFHLQPNGKWSDGTPLTASDFVYSFRRILDPALGANYTDMLYYLEGAQAYHQGKTKDPETIGAQAVDPLTLKLTLSKPTPFLPEIVKHMTWFPVPRHLIEVHGEMNEPHTAWTKEENMIGNGPFQLKAWRLNHKVEVERNPHYWDHENVLLNGIQFLPIKNAFTEARMFLDDLIHVSDKLPAEMIDQMETKFPEMVRKEPYVGVTYVTCNLKRSPFEQASLREALAASINQQAIIDNILRGGERAAYGFTPAFGDYLPPRAVSYQPNEAQKSLAQSTFDQRELHLLITDSEASKAIGEALQSMWQQTLGINVRLEIREWTTYLARRRKGEYDMVLCNWIGDFLDPTTFLDLWKVDNPNNTCGFQLPQYDQLLNKASLTVDPTQRLQTLQKAETELLQFKPMLPIYWRTKIYLKRPEVKGWNPLLLNNHPYKFVDLVPPPQS